MASLLFNALRMTERKFNLAYNQVRILDQKIEDINTRYERAKLNRQKKFCYSLRLQLSVVEGTRNMYYEYVQRMAFTLDALQKNAGLIDVDMGSDDFLSDFSDEEEEASETSTIENMDIVANKGSAKELNNKITTSASQESTVQPVEATDYSLLVPSSASNAAINNDILHETNNTVDISSEHSVHYSNTEHKNELNPSIGDLYCDESLTFLSPSSSTNRLDMNENYTYGSTDPSVIQIDNCIMDDYENNTNTTYVHEEVVTTGAVSMADEAIDY